MGADQVTADIVRETISVGFEDLDARLARNEYSPKTLADQFDLTHSEARRFFER